MFDTFAEFYVRAFTVLIPGLALLLLAVAGAGAGLRAGRIMAALVPLAVIFGLWLSGAAAMAEAGLLMPPPTLADPPYVMMFMLGGAAMLWGLARWTAPGRALTDTADQRLLIGFQIPRVMGAVFLLGWATGDIPWQFALPAGLGDIWAGVAALQAVRALNRGDASATRLVRRANIIGLGDFVVAVTTGLITSEGFLHLLSRDAGNIINAYPLGLFPAFFVPIFIAAHLLSIGRLRRTRLAPAAA